MITSTAMITITVTITITSSPGPSRLTRARSSCPAKTRSRRLYGRSLVLLPYRDCYLGASRHPPSLLTSIQPLLHFLPSAVLPISPRTNDSYDTGVISGTL